MTVPISSALVKPNNLVGALSRYLKQNVIYYGNENLLTFDTYIRNSYKVTGTERVAVITKGVEFRPDLVSYQVYNTPDAWWKIMEVNGIYDIYDFKAGLTIILPQNLS